MGSQDSTPTLEDIRAARASLASGSNSSEPTLEDVRAARASLSPDKTLGEKALGYLTTGAKALNSVTIAPVQSAVYAAENGESPWQAAKNQFANMDQDAPSGKDIMMKAGLSGNASSPRLANADNNYSGFQGDRMAMMQLGANTSPAGVAGAAFDQVANPINLIAPAAGKFAKTIEPIVEGLANKPTANAIREAASRLGFTATPGMISDSQVVQGLEDSLSQSPSLMGALARHKIKPVAHGIQSAAEDLVSGAPATSSSAYQAGNSAQNGVLASLGEKANNIKMSYEPFNQELPKMVPHAEDRWKLADEIYKVGQQHLDPNEVNGIVQGATNKVMNSTSLADIEDTRKLLGNKIQQAYSNNDHNLADTLTKIKDKLSDFRDTQFEKLSSQAYPGAEGASIGQSMVSEYKAAGSQHAALMKDLREVGPLFGIKAKNPRDFIESFSEIPPEQVATKLFKTNNVQALQKVQSYFPEEFETIKGLKLQELRKTSLANPLDPSNSAVDASKLITKINKMTPEVQQVLFGDKAQKLKDMQTVLGSYPEHIGPSGTPKGEMFTHFADPTQQVADVARYGAYRALGSKTGSKILTETPKVLTAIPKSSGPIASVIEGTFGQPTSPSFLSTLPKAAGPVKIP